MNWRKNTNSDLSFEHEIIYNLNEYITISPKILEDLLNLANLEPREALRNEYKASLEIPLFKNFPALQHTIPHIKIADLPTPITKCDTIARECGIGSFYIKRDDLTGKMRQSGRRFFGGNKVRALEFLLGDVLNAMHNYAPGTRAVLTFGPAGSSHALATATYAQRNMIEK